MNPKVLTSKLLVCFVLLAMSAAGAAEPSAEPTYSFDIQSQPLRTAVQQFSVQAGVDFAVSDGTQAARIKVNAVSGNLTLTEALRIMLESTGVEYSQPLPNLIVFRVPPPRRDKVPPPGFDLPEQIITANRDRARNPIWFEAGTGFDPWLWPAREVHPDEFGSAASGLLSAALTDATLGLGAKPAGELGSIAGNQTEVNLFGLGTTDNVVLINGRPMAGLWLGGSLMQPKLGVIPRSAVDRIRIAAGSASSVYGGGATGTIDVAFRKGYEGLRLDATLGGAHDTDASASVSYGGRFFDDRTKITLNLGVSKENPVLMSERDGLAEGRARILQNNPGYWYSRGAPPLASLPNVMSANGNDLGEGLGQFAQLPEGYGAVASAPKIAQGYNLTLANTSQNDGGREAVLQSGMVGGFFIAQADHQFTSRNSVFVELLATSLKSRGPASAAGYLGLEGVRVPDDGPEGPNPFNEPVRVTRELAGADGILDERNEAWRGTLGTSWQINDAWSLKAEHVRSVSRLRWTQPAAWFAADDAASGVLNVFQDPALGPLDVSKYLYTQGSSWLPSQSDSSMLEGSGKLVEGRKVRASVTVAAMRRADKFGGATFWRESPTEQRVEENPLSRQYQETWSAFTGLNAAYGDFGLQIAGRWDRTSMQVSAPHIPPGTSPSSPPAKLDFTSFNPMAALQWRALPDLSLRASIARGYVMPTVTQLVAAPARPVPPGMFTDPQRGYELLTGAMVLNGGNPALKPEKAETFSTGITLTPRVLPNLVLSVDHIRIWKHGDISSLAGFDLQSVERVDRTRVGRGEPLPGEPWSVGPVVRLDLSDANLSWAKAELWQAEVRGMTRSRAWGRLEWFARGTWQPDSLRQLTADSAVVDDAGISSDSPLRLGVAGRLMWRYEKWSLGWTTRHVGSYRVSNDPVIILNQGGEDVPAQTFHDVSIGWHREKLEGWPYALDLQLSVANVFDRAPEFDAGAGWYGYQSPYVDPRLRHGVLMLSVTF